MTVTLFHRRLHVANVEIATSMAVDEAIRLQELARDRKVLEVGSAHGYSTVLMACDDSEHIWAVDPHEDDAPGNPLRSLEHLQANLQASGLEDKVTIIAKRFDEALPELRREKRRFGLVFLDADHSYKAVKHDVQAGWALLAPGGVLAVHDYDEASCPDVRPAVDEIFPDGPDRLTDTLWEKQKPKGGRPRA